MKQIIIIGLIILLSIGNVSAVTYHMTENLYGEWCDEDDLPCSCPGDLSDIFSIGESADWIVTASWNIDNDCTYCTHWALRPEVYTTGQGHISMATSTSAQWSATGSSTSIYVALGGTGSVCYCCPFTMTATMVASTDEDKYSVSGTLTCATNESTELYIYHNSEYKYIGMDSGTSYSFSVFNNTQYKLKFENSFEYVFTVAGENVVYNYDACDHYVLNLLDNCANPLIDPYTTIFENMTEIIYEGNDNPISFTLPTDAQVNDYIQIIIDTTDGAVQYNDYISIIEQDLYHNFVAWDMNIHVVDDSTGSDISGAQVVLSQNCAIDLPNTKNVISTATGHAIFTGLSNSNMGVSVTKTGYNTYSKTITVGSIFNCWSTGGSFTVYMNSTTGNSTDDYQNGTHNDSAADGTGEETLPENHGYGCGVYFKNTEGVITDTINDTDTHVDMYYWVKGSDAILKFQHQIYTYWYTDKEYSVSNNTFEYRRILNANFTDYTSAYRGHIYNTTQDCNSIQKLYVINQTYEAETDYENLTSHCWIKNKLSGNEIDYRSDIKCMIYANSTNSSLLGITAHFMNQSTEVDSIILNWADFVSGSPKWYYVWYPDYEYTSGYNYTLNITGFDEYQLDTDEVWTADIIGNTLTVYVKDNHDAPLAYSTVFVQGWGSAALDTLTYISITGLSDGGVQYKATKSGYLSSAWSNITLDGSDESVTCILTKSATESVTGYKLKDAEIKEFFIPLMYMLLIMILLGGLMNAAKK